MRLCVYADTHEEIHAVAECGTNALHLERSGTLLRKKGIEDRRKDSNLAGLECLVIAENIGGLHFTEYILPIVYLDFLVLRHDDLVVRKLGFSFLFSAFLGNNFDGALGKSQFTLGRQRHIVFQESGSRIAAGQRITARMFDLLLVHQADEVVDVALAGFPHNYGLAGAGFLHVFYLGAAAEWALGSILIIFVFDEWQIIVLTPEF